jgi:Amt family ammonium transporter
VNAFIRIRATGDEELAGLDATMHGEEAYRDLVMASSVSRSVFREKTAESTTVSAKGETA